MTSSPWRRPVWSVPIWSGPVSEEHLLVDPHEGARVAGFALVLDAAEAVAPLAVVPLAVVVELDLPHRLQAANLGELSTG